MGILQVTLFGKAAILRGDSSVELPAKAQEMLFYLLLHRCQPHTREALACELWADTPLVQAKKYLRQCLWQLQQMVDLPQDETLPLLRLDHEWIEIHPQAYFHVDTRQLEQAFGLVRDIDGRSLSVQQAQVVQEAVALYRGDLLMGWYQDWCLIAREHYQSMFIALLDKLMDNCETVKRFDQGITYGMRLLGIDYTRESTHRRLMRLYSAAGDRTGALRQFHHCAAALEKEFGVQPTNQTVALFEQIRGGEDGSGSACESTPLASAETNLITTLLAELTIIRAYVATLQHDIQQIKHVQETLQQTLQQTVQQTRVV